MNKKKHNSEDSGKARFSKCKKAQSGSIIVSFPIILFIVLIMAVFVFISGTNALIKKPNELQTKIFLEQNDELFEFKTVEIKGEERSLMLLEILQLYLKKEISFREAESAFSDFLKKKNVNKQCLIIYPDSNIFYLYYETNGEQSKVFTAAQRDNSLLTDFYERPGLMNYILVRDDKQELKKIKYYYGGCLTNS